jgi:hypothetical protein
LELAELAVARKAAADRGVMGTTSLEELGAEFGVVVPRGLSREDLDDRMKSTREG